MVEQQVRTPLNRREVGRVEALDKATLAAIRVVQPAPECMQAMADLKA